MKALSVKQPFARWIAEGHKTNEIRGWETPYRGLLLIVSCKKPFDDVHPGGVAVAVVRLVGISPLMPKHLEWACLPKASKAQCAGQFAWHLSLIGRVVNRVEIQGRLGLYEVSYDYRTIGKEAGKTVEVFPRGAGER